ncbi:MAG: phytoene/squalene synthase family protein [Alphaproteobacteria bacterium]|nr:phytoene/squalene synthase family protein [Alphaproteobacteria bacterium]
MTDPAIIAESRAVLSTHARSFRWASAFLPPDRQDEAAILYAFCRLVDDTADEAPDPETARAGLDALEAEVRGVAPRPLVAAACAVLEQGGVGVGPALELITGARCDLDGVRISEDRALIRYGYRVAGTVGLMMTGVIGATDPAARPHAVDLGVAMQLTNICRDVLEDARMGRVYLPETRLREAGVDPDDLLRGDADRAGVARVVGALLDLAERYYASADAGMRYIPWRCRVAILVASRVYRAIGLRLKREGCDALAGRTIVPGWEKALWVLAALLAAARLQLVEAVGHDAGLHQHLRDLPGLASPGARL